MEVIEAIKARKSIRGFLPKPVPEEVLTEVLNIGVWSPSTVNAQSWEFVVLTGKTLEAVKQANAEQFAKGTPPRPDIGLTTLTGPCRQRQVQLGKELYQLVGIPKGDTAGMQAWTRKNMTFFDAPAAILVFADREVPGLNAVMNTGLVIQTICLAALNYGLGTCLQWATGYYPDLIRKIVDIPESKMLYVSVAIGYPDWDAPANKLRSSREPLSNICTWRR